MNMETKNPITEQKLPDEFSLREFSKNLRLLGKYIRKKWTYFALWAFVGGILGLAYNRLQNPSYTAECTFVLEEKSAGGGGLAGLASQFSFDLGGMTGSSLFAGDNLLEIVPSKNIVEKVLLSKVDSNSNITLADLYLDFSKMKQSWSKNERLKNIGFINVKNSKEMSLLQDSILNVIYKQVIKGNLAIDWARKKASIIKVVVTSKNEQFSKYMTERVVNEAMVLYVDLKTATSQINVNRLQKRADSLLTLLNNKSYQTAESQVLNANPALKQVLVPTEIGMRDKTVLGGVYSEVVKNLETSKIMLSQQTPVIQILDKSEFPLEMVKKGMLICLFIGIMLPLFIVLFYFMIKYYFAK